MSKLTKDSNCRVIFCDSHCEFQDQNSGKKIGSAKMINGLYYFVGNFSSNFPGTLLLPLDAVYRILRYPKRTPGRDLLFKNCGHLNVEAYTDTDWAGSIVDRRSTSGYCMFVGGNLVTWRSKKQNVVARSSTEAEFRSVAHGICEVLWIKRLLKELKISNQLPIKVYCDNKATISIAHTLALHDKTKHVEVDKHFIKEKLENGLIAIHSYC